MYRDRPPPRGGYPPPFEGRDHGPPPPGRPYPPPPNRDGRSRPAFHQGYHDHGPSDSYRRSPPRRRYPSPGPGSHRGSEYWGSGPPPRERSPSPRGGLPLDHKLIITVGNELTGPPGSSASRNSYSTHDRDYPPKSGHAGPNDWGSQRRRPRSRSRSRSPDRSRGRSKSRAYSRGRSPERSRAKSRGRSKSRAYSPSPERSRAKSRGRSKSRARSRSKSSSRPRSRSRSRGRRYSVSRAHSKSRRMSRSRSRSVSTSSTSSSQSSEGGKKGPKGEFQELELARRRKQMEEILSQPTKSILKKRMDSEDSPSVMSNDSPRDVSRIAEHFITAVKGMEPHLLASMMAELKADPQMAQRAGLDAETAGILNLLGSTDLKPAEKSKDDIDDEERFLYGDDDEPRSKSQAAPEKQANLADLYADVTEEALYGDYPQQHAAVTPTYNVPPMASPHIQTHGLGDHTSRTLHLQPQVDMRYQSRSTITPEQNIQVEVPNPAYPPGTGPLDEKEKQEVDEYEKIQDLLKTIGLDLGVADITKMAARTKERLQGSKPPPKTPTRQSDRRSRYHSSGSDSSCSGRGRRSHSRSQSSDSSSSSHSRSRGRSWSSDEGRRRWKKSSPAKHSTQGKSQNVKEGKNDRAWESPVVDKTALQSPLDTKNIAIHPAHLVSPYGPSQPHDIVPPNYPPPGYGQYGNYMPYMPPQQWPPMYPPPGMGMPPLASHDYQKNTQTNQPYHKASLKDSAVKGESSKSTFHGIGKEESKATLHERRLSEEQNNESQKQKVLEEREKLRRERDIRMKKKEYLMKELERLRKQQGELLRKKRREKDGHKDPLLSEISRLQEELMSQISDLRKEHEAAEIKRKEIETVALVLGLAPSSKPRKVIKTPEDGEGEQQKKHTAGSSERLVSTSSAAKSLESSARASPDKQKQIGPAVSQPPASIPPPFEYYDAGNHWCKNCNVTSGSMFDFFTHLHSKPHRKTQDPYNRPWAASGSKTETGPSLEEKLTKPAKGSEFLLPVRGFFCLLCREFYGDAVCAEEHVLTHAHNEKYKKQMYENPFYEQRRNLDRQAGLQLESGGKKRKHEDEADNGKQKEEKPKHKKDKKDKKDEKKEEKAKKEEEKHKQHRKDTDENPLYSKDEDEKCKYSKKEDIEKRKYSKVEEERDKFNRIEEGDRYKYTRDEENRHRYHREEENERYRYSKAEEKSKHSWRDNDDYDDRYKYSRSKHDRSEEDRYKLEKDERRKDEKEAKQSKRPEHFKEEEKSTSKKPTGPPPKPYDLPKVLCGPSPAMRAKLRKQSAETAKVAPVEMAKAPTSTFGKFTWKKKENVLAKEAERVAAEFLQDEEAAVANSSVPPEDSFAKSVAVAKEIALKLTGQSAPPPPPPFTARGTIPGRIRPNLPVPTVIERKTMANLTKPAPLNTFLSIQPQNTSTSGVAPIANLAETVPSEPVKELPMSSHTISRAFDSEVVPLQDTSKMANLQSSKAPVEKKIRIESDVSVPGVPESEQNLTVFVKPPPFMNAGDGAHRSDRPKSNLAAAKAQDLFEIFYSSIGHPAPSSLTKPSVAVKGAGSNTKKMDTSISKPVKSDPPLQTKPQSEDQLSPAVQTQDQSSLLVKPTPPQSPIHSEIQPTSNVEPVCPITDSKVEQPPPQPPVQINPVQLKDIPQPQPQPESVVKSETVHSEPLPPLQLDGLTPDSDPVISQPSLQAQPESQLTPQNEITSQPAVETEKSSLEPVPSSLEPHSPTQPEPEPETSPKTKTKTSPQTKKKKPTRAPARQTRSQTRYQTRNVQQKESQDELEPQQKQSQDELEPQPDPVVKDDDQITEHTELPETDGTVSQSEASQSEATKPENGTTNADLADESEQVTTETLGLPSDVLSLGFEYDFNFE